jgi:hypothetical protein
VDFEALVAIDEPADLGSCSMHDLRAVRDAYQDVENGLSYARRMVQGRLDTVSSELERRRGVDTSELVDRLPSALAGNTRGPGMPRPPQDLAPPEWAASVVAELDAFIGPGELGRLADLDDARLATAAEQIATYEREVSNARREVHTRMDRIQEELIARYRDGASVDDLLP